jgi:hypothetical protein
LTFLLASAPARIPSIVASEVPQLEFALVYSIQDNHRKDAR